MFDADVVVVGGGLAGVRAARDAADAGATVLVLEARDRLGGRVWTRPFQGRRELIELGGTWIAPDVHPYVAQEIARYDLELVESHGGPLERRWYLDGHLTPTLPFDNDGLYQLERVLFELIDASHRIDVDVPRDLQDLADLDVSVETLVESFGIAIPVREFLYMWAGLGSGALAPEWSALTALSWIAAMNNSVWGWYGAVTDRFEIGMSAVIDLIARDSGARIELSSPVARITDTASEVTVVTGGGRRYTSCAVIVATPIATWNEIDFAPALPDDKLIPARAGHAGRMRKIWMVVEGLPANMFASGWGSPFVQLFPEVALPDGCLALGMCSPPAELDATDLDAVTAAVRVFAPGARVLAADTHDWMTDPHSRGGWMVNPPGVLSRYHSALSRREGRIAFAGSDIAVRWIGWLDGALETGARAAEEALSIMHAGSRGIESD
jgi:monoamine oxidase